MLTMEEQFISYEDALKLKELGFNEHCLAYFWNGKFYLTENTQGVINAPDKYELPAIIAPLWQQAFDWFLKKYGLFQVIHVHEEGYSFNIQNLNGYRGVIQLEVSTIIHSLSSGEWFKSKEEAREACLNELINLAVKMKPIKKWRS